MNSITATTFQEREIPKNFDGFLEYFDEWIQGQKSTMKSFLGVDYTVKITYEDYHTFAFSPSDKRIIIPNSFLKNFHTNLTEHKQGNPFLYSFDDLKFSIYHELSHFRDMIHENDSNKRGAMIDILKYVQKQKINIGNKKYIPIGSQMHTLVNCIDDIIVNTEVEMSLQTKISKEHLEGFYIYNLFPDIHKKEGGDYILNDEGRPKYVGNGNGTHHINDSEEVDYSKDHLSRALPYFLLRSFMVKSQHIQLPEKVQNILFSSENRRARPSWKKSIERQIGQMKAYFNEISKDETYKKRTNDFKSEYIAMIEVLEKVITDTELEKLLAQSIKNTNTTNRFGHKTISLIDIIQLFLLSSGKENSHALDISPGMRYEIYKKLFLPLQKSYILMDLLTQDIKEDENKNGQGQGQGEGEREGEGKGEGQKQEQGEGKKASGTEGVHESPDIDAKIKLLEELEEEAEKQKEEELAKKQVEQRKYDVESILESSDVGEVGKEILEHISSKYHEYIKEIVEFFIEELAKMERQEIREEYYGKKGKLNARKVVSYVSDDPSLAEIDKQKLYKRHNYRETVSETLKKIDLTLAIDISASTSSFRGKDGIMNIISTVLFIAMKHIEQHIQNTLGIHDYSIPVEFLLYGDDTPYSSYHSKNRNSTHEVRIAEMNEKLITLGGGTNDTTAWQKIAHEFDAHLSKNPEYTQEIIDNKRKPIILQIADSDVSENGVESIQDTMKKHLHDDDIVNSLPIKRIILGNISNMTLTKEEYEIRKKEYEIRKKDGQIGNWEPNFLPDGSVQLKQIAVKSKDEIIEQIQSLFKNFFADMKQNI